MTSTTSPAPAHTAKDGKGILITEPAMQQLAKLCSEQGDQQVLRVGVRSGGCSGMSYTMDFVPASDTLEDDETYEYVAANGQSFRVICDPKSLLYIYGMQLDFSTALIGGGFNFTNPNASQTCGCGSSLRGLTPKRRVGSLKRCSARLAMESSQENLFDQAMARYQAGASAAEILPDFIKITEIAPRQAAGWTCLAWLQLLCDQPEEALRSARFAVKLSPQDPQARINLSLALLETDSKGVRDQIQMVQQVLTMAPQISDDLKGAMDDGLVRRPGWKALEKVKSWLNL